MKRAYLMRRPKGSSDEEEEATEEVRAKPIPTNYSKRLGESFKSKDFVRGHHQDADGAPVPMTSRQCYTSSATPQLSHDERNKLMARIMKAEFKGNKDLADSLRRQLESGEHAEKSAHTAATTASGSNVLLVRTDKKTGLIMPACSKVQAREDVSQGDESVTRQMMEEMVRNERATTVVDQISIFSAKADELNDDEMIGEMPARPQKKKRHIEKETRIEHGRRIRDHKETERTLESCRLCIDSRRLEKHAVVATGLKTYLAVVPWDGLDHEHCFIAPMQHYISTVTLDEDVYDEMRLWCKGLVAMWKADVDDEAEGRDCIFVECAKRIQEQQHLSVECIPLSRTEGDLAPIHFKKALLEFGDEFKTENKKLIDMAKFNGDLRRAIPKGFPYLAVNFGLQPGYAHAIEKVDHFPDYFAQEIIGDMKDLPHTHWRNCKPQSVEKVKQKRDRLRDKWEKFDWTHIVKDSLKEAQQQGGTSSSP